MRQLQARKGSGSQHHSFYADAETVKLMDRAREMAESIYGLQLSNAVLLRRAARELWLRYIEEVYRSASNPGSEEAAERMIRFLQAERELIEGAAKGLPLKGTEDTDNG